jgi:hypothetical protein
LGVVLLARLSLSLGGALLLFGLFIGQFVLPVFSTWFPHLAFGLGAPQIHPVFSVLYFVVALAFFLDAPKLLWRLREGLKGGIEECQAGGELEEMEGGALPTPRCETCKYRRAAAAGKRV